MPHISTLLSRSKGVSLTLVMPQLQAMPSLPKGCVESLVPLMHRMGTMQLCVEGSNALQLLRVPAPRLGHLEISGRLHDDQTDLGELFCDEAPCLRSMTLHYTSIPSGHQTFSTLRSLQISDSMATAEGILGMLRRCPNLHTFSMRSFAYPLAAAASIPSLESLVHSTLSNVTLHELPALLAHTFLTRLQLPACNFLSIQLDLKHFVPFFRPLSSHFDASLEITAIDITSTRITCVARAKTIILESIHSRSGGTIDFRSGVLRLLSLPLAGTAVDLVIDSRKRWHSMVEGMLDGLKGRGFLIHRITLRSTIDGVPTGLMEYLATPSVIGGGSLDGQALFLPFPWLNEIILEAPFIPSEAIVKFVAVRSPSSPADSLDGGRVGLTSIQIQGDLPRTVVKQIESLGVSIHSLHSDKVGRINPQSESLGEGEARPIIRISL